MRPDTRPEHSPKIGWAKQPQETAPQPKGGHSSNQVDDAGNHGNDVGVGTEGRDGRGQTNESSSPQMATHSEHHGSQKPTDQTQGASGGNRGANSQANGDVDSRGSKSGAQPAPADTVNPVKRPHESDPQPKGGHSSNVSRQVDDAVNKTGVRDRDKILAEINSGGKLDHSKIDGTAMLNRSYGAAKEAVGDIVVDGAKADINFVENVANDFTDMAKNSANSGVKFADNIQNSIESGVKNLLGSNEEGAGRRNNISDNDLPPNPKN